MSAKVTTPAPKASAPVTTKVKAQAVPLTAGTQLIPLANIRKSDDIPNRPLDKELVAALTDDIAKNGLLNNLVVWNGGGKKGIGTVSALPSGRQIPTSFLVAGEHRRAALRNLEKNRNEEFLAKFPGGLIPCSVLTGSMEEVLCAQLRENVMRKEPSFGDLLPFIKRLLSDFKLKQSEVARRIGKDDAFVSSVLAVERELGSEAVEEAVGDGVKFSTLQRATAAAVKTAKKTGVPVNGKAVVQGIKSKKAALASAGRERAPRRIGAATLLERFDALPRRSVTDQNIMLKEIIRYVGKLTDDLPPELISETDGE